MVHEVEHQELQPHDEILRQSNLPSAVEAIRRVSRVIWGSNVSTHFGEGGVACCGQDKEDVPLRSSFKAFDRFKSYRETFIRRTTSSFTSFRSRREMRAFLP